VSCVSGLVSTVIPVHNRATMLREAVASVLAQTWQNVEIIIVDDESTDDTPAVIAELMAADPERIRSVRRPNGGPGAARESGRQMIRGAYVQYLDSDDLLLPDKFTDQVQALQQRPDCGIAYGKTHHAGVGMPLEPVAFKRTGEVFEQLFPSVLRSRWWSTSTPLYRREVVDALGPWLPLVNEEDWEYDARTARLGVRLVHCPEFGSVTRWHDEGRLHVGGSEDPRKLADRTTAHLKILDHALASGVERSCPELQWFARDLFHLARCCARAGLASEAEALVDASARAASSAGKGPLDLRVFTRLGRALGWSTAAALAAGLERLRGTLKVST
jgi:hypothetical protein